MKYIKVFLILTTAILGLLAINTFAQSYGSKNVLSETIEVRARKEILRLPYYGVFDSISIEVEGSRVRLFGKVVQPTTRSSAKRVVERITGVSEVINNIEVLPLSTFDNSIRYRTLRTLSNQGGLYRYFLGTSPPVRIIVERGHLSLEGYVDNRGDYNLMNVLANGVSGVFSVKNNLIIEKGDSL